MTDTYSRACTELLIILKYYLSKTEFNKIPKDKIESLLNEKLTHTNQVIQKAEAIEKKKSTYH